MNPPLLCVIILKCHLADKMINPPPPATGRSGGSCSNFNLVLHILNISHVQDIKHKVIMKNLKNKVQLIGNLGKDPEVKQLNSGKTVANLSIATSETYKNAEGEKITDTQWHNLVAWGKTAEFAENYLKKGNKVAIDGKLINRTYEDKEGIKRYVTEILVNEFLMLTPKDQPVS